METSISPEVYVYAGVEFEIAAGRKDKPQAAQAKGISSDNPKSPKWAYDRGAILVPVCLDGTGELMPLEQKIWIKPHVEVMVMRLAKHDYRGKVADAYMSINSIRS